MKMISKSAGLRRLKTLQTRFAENISINYERRAKPCSTCETKGACCLDAHFVNVHITRLEAEAIRNVIEELPQEKRQVLEVRIDKTIEKYDLSEHGDTFSQTYACPLFEKDNGCLVHGKAKPFPCIHHACYENKNDLPPDELLDKASAEVERLNQRVYRERAVKWLPLPIAIKNALG